MSNEEGKHRLSRAALNNKDAPSDASMNRPPTPGRLFADVHCRKSGRHIPFNVETLIKPKSLKLVRNSCFPIYLFFHTGEIILKQSEAIRSDQRSDC